MLTVNETLIQAELIDVLETLKSELSVKNGIDLFAVFRNSGYNIQTNCPFHKDGHEAKPSFGINVDTGKCHCFACGWSGTIDQMISEIFGYQDEGKFGMKWLIRHFNSTEIITRNKIEFNPRHKILGDQVEATKEDELDSYRYIHPYMYERGLTLNTIERFDIGYDRKTDSITFPITDHGKVLFVAKRSVTGKFFRLPPNKSKPIYLMDEFLSGKYKKAYICESFFNALTLWQLDKPAMALIGLGNKRQYQILRNLPVREYVICLDPDEAGRKATVRFKCQVKNKLLKEIEYQEEGKDINDLGGEFLDLKEIF
jgi:DNA primase